MNRPKKIMVAPHPYVVLEMDVTTRRETGLVGACLNDDLKILIDPSLAPSQRREVLLHESLHAIWSQTQLDIDYPDEGSDSKGEAIILTLAPRIMQLLRDNPQLVAYLLEK